MSDDDEGPLLRLLRRVASGSRILRRGEGFRFERPGKRGRRQDLTADAPAVRDALMRGLLAADDDGGFSLAPPGIALVRRAMAEGDAFAAQHQERVRRLGDSGLPLVANAAESPLAWLRRRRSRDGRPLLDAAQYAAGERLRADYTGAQLMTRLTANWDMALPPSRRTGGAGGVADLTDAAVAARRRVEQAVAAVGPDFAGLLVDFCCFLKGIEEIERERQWPARSAKLVLQFALSALARHYGLEALGQGRADGAGIRHWGGDGYRPAASAD
jgi:hypothetical protein